MRIWVLLVGAAAAARLAAGVDGERHRLGPAGEAPLADKPRPADLVRGLYVERTAVPFSDGGRASAKGDVGFGEEDGDGYADEPDDGNVDEQDDEKFDKQDDENVDQADNGGKVDEKDDENVDEKDDEIVEHDDGNVDQDDGYVEQDDDGVEDDDNQGHQSRLARRQDTCETERDDDDDGGDKDRSGNQEHDDDKANKGDDEDSPDDASPDVQLGGDEKKRLKIMRDAERYSEAEFVRLSPGLGLASLESSGPASRLRSVLKESQGLSAGTPLRAGAWLLYAKDLVGSASVEMRAWDRAALITSIFPIVDCGVYALAAEASARLDAIDSALCTAGDALLVSGVGAIPGMAVHAVRAVRDQLLGRELPSDDDLTSLRNRQWSIYLERMHHYLESKVLAEISRVYLRLDMAVVLFEATEAYGQLRAGTAHKLVAAAAAAGGGGRTRQRREAREQYRAHLAEMRHVSAAEMRQVKDQLRAELTEQVWEALDTQANEFNNKFIAGFEADVANGTYQTSVLSWLLGNRHEGVDALVASLRNSRLPVPRRERVARFVNMRLDAFQVPQLCGGTNEAATGERRPCIGGDDKGGVGKLMGGASAPATAESEAVVDEALNEALNEVLNEVPDEVVEQVADKAPEPCATFDKVVVDVEASNGRGDGSWDRMSFMFGDSHLYVNVKRKEKGVFWRRSLPTKSLFGSRLVPVDSIQSMTVMDIALSVPTTFRDSWTLRGWSWLPAPRVAAEADDGV